MSNRSLYKNGIEVHATHLQNTEAQRTAADKQIIVDTSTRGVVSGLAVTVGGTNTRISIATGSAYAPNGEFMTLAVAQSNVALASSTLGAITYVLLVYDEVDSQPESHETDGTTQNTKATVSPRIAIVSDAQYAALPLNDSVLTSNDRNRATIIAKVTANGIGVALTTGSIESPSPFPNALRSTQPVNTTGVVIIAVDSNTTLGNGTLAFNFATTALTWAAPGDTAGTPVVLTTSQAYTITSNAGNTILVRVSFSSIPSSNKSDIVVISDIYTQSVLRNSAIDDQHRSMLGTGEPSSVNPHGMTLADLSPGTIGTIEEHQDVQHHNGLARFNAANTLALSVNAGGSPDTLIIDPFQAGDYAYINGVKIIEIADETANTWGAPEGTAPSTWGVYLDQDGVINKTKRTAFNATTDLVDKVQIVNMSDGLTGPFTIQWLSSGTISVIGGASKVAPTNDSIIRLDVGDQVNWIEIHIKGAATPGVTQSDVITVVAQPNMEENIRLGYVYWSGSGTGSLGYGFGLGNANNLVFDSRPFGTLGRDEMADEAGYTPPTDMAYELFGDGVSPRTEGHEFSTVNQRSSYTAVDLDFKLGTLAFPNITVTGGHATIGGKLFKLPPNTYTTLQASNTNRMYVDNQGNYYTSTSTWDAIVSAQDGRPIFRIAEIVINGANAETSRVDRRVYSGAKHDVSGGVVGLSLEKTATIATTTTASGLIALSVSSLGTNGSGVAATATGAGVAITGIAAGSGEGVVGMSLGAAAGVRGTATGTGVGLEGHGGITSGNGATMTGTAAGSIGGEGVGGPTSGIGLKGTGTGTGTGVRGVGGTTNGSTGALFTCAAAIGTGGQAEGKGTGFGFKGIGGDTDGWGIEGEGSTGSASGGGVKGTGFGTGTGGWFISGNGAAGDGALGTALSTNGYGFRGVGKGTGAGIIGTGTGDGGQFTGGTGKYGVVANGVNVAGVRATATGTTTAILSDGFIDLNGGSTPTSAPPKNTLTKNNMTKAWASVGFHTDGTPILLNSFNVSSIGAGTIANSVRINFGTSIGQLAITGTTTNMLAISAAVLEIVDITTSPFTAADVGRYIVISAGGNLGQWRIATYVNATSVRVDMGVGAANDAVGRGYTIYDTHQYIATANLCDDLYTYGAPGPVDYTPRIFRKGSTSVDFMIRDQLGAILALTNAIVRLMRIDIHICGIQN